MLMQVYTPSPKPGVLLLAHVGRSAVGQIYLPDPRARPAVDVAEIAPLRVVGDDHEQPVLAVSRRWCLDRRLQNLGEKFVGHRIRPEVSDRARRMDSLEQPDFAHGFLRRNSTTPSSASQNPCGAERFLADILGPPRRSEERTSFPAPMSNRATLGYSDAIAQVVRIQTGAAALMAA